MSVEGPSAPRFVGTYELLAVCRPRQPGRCVVPDAPCKYAGQLAKRENAAGTGSIDDLLRSGVRPTGWPAAIPGHEAFVVTGKDAGIAIFDLWYLDGPTEDRDPDLVTLANTLFLTRVMDARP